MDRFYHLIGRYGVGVRKNATHNTLTQRDALLNTNADTIAATIASGLSDHFDVKMRAVRAHVSQFHNPSSKEPETLISQKNFLEQITGNALDMAKQIGCSYAEGFTSSRHIGASNLFDLI